MAFKAKIGGRHSPKNGPVSPKTVKPAARTRHPAPKRDALASILQAKLTVNAPGDAYEREADSVAARILQMPEQEHKRRPVNAGHEGASIQRKEEDEVHAKCAACAEREQAQTAPLQLQQEEEEMVQEAPLQREEEEEDAMQAERLQREMEEEETVQEAPLQREEEEEDAMQAERLQRETDEEEMAQEAPLQREEDEEEAMQAEPLQRQEEGEDEEEIQTAAAAAARHSRRRMSARFETRLQHLKSTGGTPMTPALRHYMESRFGHSFAHVRVHTNAEAAALSRQAGARAFTTGRHIVFNRAEYRPTSDAGRRLLAHELTHVLQQQGGLHSVQREIFAPGPDAAMRSPRRDELLRRLERIVGTESGQLPAAIQAIVSEVLRMAAQGPDADDLRALLADEATAAETRRLIETTDYTLRLTVRRSDLGARAEWELLRTGETEPFYNHLEESGAHASVPDGGVDEMRISVATPLPARYRTNPDVEPMAGRPPPAPEPSAEPSSQPTRTRQATDGTDTSALDAADSATRPSVTADNTPGRGDGSGTDAPQIPRAPVDQDTGEEDSEEPAADTAPDIRRAARAGVPATVDPASEKLVRDVMTEPGSRMPAPLAGDMSALLGHDVSTTRLYHGPRAARAAARLGARAFAHRDAVVFGHGQFQPGTRTGRALLAHELTHVRQYHEGRGLSFLKRDEECPPPEPVPEVEVVSSPASAGEDPAFQSMENRADNRAASQSAHGSGEDKSEDANAAAPVTEGENRTHAQSDQVGTMEAEAANPPAFDREAFIQSVLDEVERIAPETLNDVMEFKNRGTAGQVKSAVEGEAASAAGDTQDPLNRAASEDPGPGQSPRAEQPLSVEPPGPQPGSVRADRAMPPPRTDSEVEMRSETVRTENILREACITRSYMDEHGDPELGAAAQAQDGLQEATEQAPQNYRTQEAGALQNARAGASQTGANGITDLFQNRSENFAGVGNAQGAAATENARKRQEVAAEVNTIFTDTQSAVTDRLDTMTSDVNTTFDTEANAAVAKFENFIRTNAEIYENNWLEDLADLLSDVLFDEPPAEVWDFYGEGRRIFIADMRLAIGNVADIVETGLREARELVEDGKRRVEEKLSTLGDDLADFRSEISDQMNERFSGLEGDINSRRGQLVQSLGQRYARALEQVRSIEQQVRDEYSTWVDSARDAYNAAVDFITGWIERLTSIVGDAATRIIREPAQFLRNLGAGIVQGLTMFMDNIGDNIKSAVVTWLTGNLGSAGIEVPTSFDARSLIGFAMELVGLGLTNIKNIARRVFGRRVVALIEAGAAGFEHIKRLFDILVTEGPKGLFEHLRSEFERIKGELMEKIGRALAESLIVAGIRRVLGIVSGLVSGGAGTVITIVTAIIDVVLWFRDNAAQLAELVSTIAGMAMAVLNGQVGALASAIDGLLKRLLPIVLSFVGALVGIGGAVRKIQQIFRAIRRPATRAITALFTRLKRGIQRLLRRLTGRGRGRGGGRGRGRDRPMSPGAVVNAIVTALSRPSRQSDPSRALSDARRQADQLRAQYQPRLQRGTIRINILDTRPNQISSDGDIDFEVSINPSRRSAKPVNQTLQDKFRSQINASHNTTRDDIETSVGRIPRASANIQQWGTVQQRIEQISPAKAFLSRPVLSSHRFGQAMIPSVRQGANEADSNTTLTEGQFRTVMGKVNSGAGPYSRAKSLLKSQVFTRSNRRGVIKTAVKQAVKNDRELAGTGADLVIAEPPILSDGSISGPALQAARQGFRTKMAALSAAARAGTLRYSPGTETVRIAELQAAYRAIVESRLSQQGTLPANFGDLDADHPVDLIVGGAADQQLRMLHRGVNRSVGASLRTAAEAANLQPGDRIRSISVG